MLVPKIKLVKDLVCQNKKSISKEITNLNKDKEDIANEIDKKKKLNNKIIKQ